MNMSSSLAALALLINASVWGLSWIPFKYLNQSGIHPLWATSFIFSLSTIAMTILNKGWWTHVSKNKGLITLMLVAGATNACFNTAVTLGSVIRVILLFYVMPVWAALLARIVLKEPITLLSICEITLGMSGAAFVIYQSDPAIHGLSLIWQLAPVSLSDWLALAGGFLFAANNIQLKRLAHVSSGLCTQAMVSGAFVLCGITSIVLTMNNLLPSPTFGELKQPLTLITWSVLFLLGNLCLQMGASRLAPATTAVLMLSEVLFGAVSSWALGESVLRWQDFVGGFLIIAAGLLRVLVQRLSHTRHHQVTYNSST